MFLKELSIHNNHGLIRKIKFIKGINLIVDETKTVNQTESGNNVGKTTVLRLIDYCLGSQGNNIYKDNEFTKKGTNTQVESFLKETNTIITLILKNDIDMESSEEITIRRNFLKGKAKIQEINGENYNSIQAFRKVLTELIFNFRYPKPTFRQIITKNIRYSELTLTNTLRLLKNGKQEEYEALYFFWLGIPISSSDRKKELISLIKDKENVLKSRDNNSNEMEQALILINNRIEKLEKQRLIFNSNNLYKEQLKQLNDIRSEINKISTHIGQLRFRKELILESKKELEKEFANIDVDRIKFLYKEAEALIPTIQKTFEQILIFHNNMLEEKKKYILEELPSIEEDIKNNDEKIKYLLSKEKELKNCLDKKFDIEDFEKETIEINKLYEQRGDYLGKQKELQEIKSEVEKYKNELDNINQKIESNESSLNKRISVFNTYLPDISRKLYNENMILSYDKNKKGFELNISSIDENPGSGKKKGQIAAFDLAYIQFAENQNINCLHFILHDQIENIHDNQITSLLETIVSNINCQYILPVLRDKLPNDIDIEKYKILSLSQEDKLFKIDNVNSIIYR